jgi:hypothetical protein
MGDPCDRGNVFNHANFASPNPVTFSSNNYSSSAGVITGTSTTSRQIQFAMKLLFCAVVGEVVKGGFVTVAAAKPLLVEAQVSKLWTRVTPLLS